MASGKEGRSIVDEWVKVAVPAAPELKPVTVDPEATALLILDIQTGNCNLERRPRCVASVPKIAALLRQAREKGMLVVYSLTRSATVADVREELTPQPGEPVVRSGVDKFFGTDLETILTGHGVKAVIVTGTSAHGAVLHTSTGAALRGLEVILPVDGLSADAAYPEQYTCWHLANAPGSRRQTTLTRSDLIRF